MNVGEFCFKYERSDKDGKEKLVKDHVKKDYVDFAIKVSTCENISKWALYDKEGHFMPNTPMLEMLFVVGVIPKYTDLTFDTSNNLHDYDVLIKTGAGSALLNAIGEDAARFRDVLDMVVDDVIDHERNMVDYLNDLIIKFGEAITALEEVGAEDERSSD